MPTAWTLQELAPQQGPRCQGAWLLGPLTHGDSASPPPQAAHRGRSRDLRATQGWAHAAGPLPSCLPQSLFPLPRKRG